MARSTVLGNSRAVALTFSVMRTSISLPAPPFWLDHAAAPTTLTGAKK